MKSREYRSVITGNFYWLEDGKVMIRHRDGSMQGPSVLSAEDFFKGVGTDMLVLVEESK